MRRDRKRKLLIVLRYTGMLLLIVAIVFGLSKIQEYRDILHIAQSFAYDETKLRAFTISEEVLSYYLDDKKQNRKDIAEELTLNAMVNELQLDSVANIKKYPLTERYKKKLKENKDYKKLYQFYNSMVNDLVYFPIPEDLKGKEKVYFEDSWGSKRTYGGDRPHEGCDVMTSNNVRGYFPVISITDGIVENKGWLKLGGYRLGIRSKSGGYYYYAHLFSYAEGIEIGDTVQAGELLGFMGDSGYSEVEGTVGNFDVHLHMGMYVMLDGKETSVNPYSILRYLEKHKLAYYF